MNLPTVTEALALLEQAEITNPGPWIAHSKTTGECAKIIASRCGLDEDKAYIFGLLHDIGRRYGITDMRHIILGYNNMIELGYHDCARICLTHSFPIKIIESFGGQSQNDCTSEETEFITKFIEDIVYDDYDKLIQLCDALAYPNHPTFIEKRLVDVAMRRGLNNHTLCKWQQIFDLKTYFDDMTKTNIYELVGAKYE